MDMKKHKELIVVVHVFAFGERRLALIGMGNRRQI